MPIVKNFSFTLNTDIDTFSTWFSDRNGMWVFDATTGIDGRLIKIQMAERVKLKLRTQFSFAAVIEITDESEKWSEAETHIFTTPDWVERKGIYQEQVISIMAMAGTHASKVDIHAHCWAHDAIDGFSRILTKIAEAYPEAEAKMREQEDRFDSKVSKKTPWDAEPHHRKRTVLQLWHPLGGNMMRGAVADQVWGTNDGLGTKRVSPEVDRAKRARQVTRMIHEMRQEHGEDIVPFKHPQQKRKKKK